jgi:hypothetical protein
MWKRLKIWAEIGSKLAEKGPGGVAPVTRVRHLGLSPFLHDITFLYNFDPNGQG